LHAEGRHECRAGQSPCRGRGRRSGDGVGSDGGAREGGTTRKAAAAPPPVAAQGLDATALEQDPTEDTRSEGVPSWRVRLGRALERLPRPPVVEWLGVAALVVYGLLALRLLQVGVSSGFL
jgi:hypothetical protein